MAGRRPVRSSGCSPSLMYQWRDGSANGELRIRLGTSKDWDIGSPTQPLTECCQFGDECLSCVSAETSSSFNGVPSYHAASALCRMSFDSSGKGCHWPL